MLNIQDARTDTSDNEIARYLSQAAGLDYNQSIAEGSNDQQLIDFFVSIGHATHEAVPTQQPEIPTYENAQPEQEESYLGATKRGFEESFKQIPMLAQGLAAGVGAVGESVFGEDGVFTETKEYWAEKYQKSAAEMQKDAQPEDSIYYSWEKAKETGDKEALIKYGLHGFGYVGGQAVQALMTAGIGKMTAQAVLTQSVEKFLLKSVEKEAIKLAGKEAVTEGITKQAVKNIAGKIGTHSALGTQALGIEGGEILGGLAEQSVERDTPLTKKEVVKGIATTVVAGAVEYAGTVLALTGLKGKLPTGKALGEMTGIGGRVARGGSAVALTSAGEAAQEFTQTGLEQYGQGQDPRTPEAFIEQVEGAALGAIGGSVSLPGALLTPPKPTIEDIGTAETAEEAIAAAERVMNDIAEEEAEITAPQTTDDSGLPLIPISAANIEDIESEAVEDILDAQEEIDPETRFNILFDKANGIPDRTINVDGVERKVAGAKAQYLTSAEQEEYAGLKEQLLIQGAVSEPTKPVQEEKPTDDIKATEESAQKGDKENDILSLPGKDTDEVSVPLGDKTEPTIKEGDLTSKEPTDSVVTRNKPDKEATPQATPSKDGVGLGVADLSQKYRTKQLATIRAKYLEGKDPKNRYTVEPRADKFVIRAAPAGSKVITPETSELSAQVELTPAQKRAEKTSELADTFAKQDDPLATIYTTKKGAELGLRNEIYKQRIDKNHEVTKVDGEYRITKIKPTVSEKHNVKPLKTWLDERKPKAKEDLQITIPEEAEKDIRKQAIAELEDSDPVFSMMKEAKRVGISLASLKADWDVQGLNKRYPAVFHKQGGIDIDEFADGYNMTSDEFVELIKSARSKKQAVDELVAIKRNEWADAEMAATSDESGFDWESGSNVKFAKSDIIAQSKSTDLKQAIDALLTTNGRKNLNISVVQTLDQLPNGEEIYSGEIIQGMFNPATGKITIVADNVSIEDAWGVVLHESTHGLIAKYGFVGLFGIKAKDILADIQARTKGGNKKWVAALQKAKDAGTAKEDLAEEQLMYFLSDRSNSTQNLYRRIVNAIKTWAIKYGIKRKINDSDIIAMAEYHTQRIARKGEQSQPGQLAPTAVMASLTGKANKWYSRLQDAISLKGSTQTAAQWLKTIDTWKRKGTIPKPVQEELEWSGLTEWLTEQDGKVSKAQVVDFLANNGVSVEEVEKSNDAEGTAERIEESARETMDDEFDSKSDGFAEYMYDGITDEIETAWDNSSHKIWGKLQNSKNEYVEDEDGDTEDAKNIFEEDVRDLDWSEVYTTTELNNFKDELWSTHRHDYIEAEERRRGEDYFYDSQEPGNTKFADYQLPGGENYKELLLTLPSLSRKDAIDNEQYHSPHYDEPNIISHVRFNERTDADGNKVLFIEEIQSDQGQDYRKQLKNIEKSVTNNFKAIVQKMESLGILEEIC